MMCVLLEFIFCLLFSVCSVIIPSNNGPLLEVSNTLLIQLIQYVRTYLQLALK